jgi:cytochrome c oxidase subunit IV
MIIWFSRAMMAQNRGKKERKETFKTHSIFMALVYQKRRFIVALLCFLLSYLGLLGLFFWLLLLLLLLAVLDFLHHNGKDQKNETP